ncbi:uncharacterized protein M421DRAFT_163817 [Didymella exigua CBS 183.55]|uniref:Uncharacterized protein n=1 Tax=Didymella exigua CBS 183.55 TaxID=1150837 RepID=A0A6A5RHV6_9PLEO|nr:uncharacterized protein M421DRAFT_163817 [Didymella exigua CBS 183.55]KAF1927915.1 hypothetical protein M421DRAFT_163817 [Didymella exigua CBS 183.55]
MHPCTRAQLFKHSSSSTALQAQLFKHSSSSTALQAQLFKHISSSTSLQAHLFKHISSSNEKKETNAETNTPGRNPKAQPRNARSRNVVRTPNQRVHAR